MAVTTTFHVRLVKQNDKLLDFILYLENTFGDYCKPTEGHVGTPTPKWNISKMFIIFDLGTLYMEIV